VQALDSPYAAQRQREPIPSRPGPVCLSGEAAAGAQRGRVHKARALGREAEILLAQVKLPDIVVALAAVLLRGCDIAGAPRRVVGREGELGGDLLERVLGVGQSELVAEEGRFRRPAVRRRGGRNVVQRGFDVRLGLLHQTRDVEHGFGPAKI
jgi:hypothetical protein